MRWNLLDDNGNVIEMCAACKVCGNPTQTTDSLCYKDKPTRWQNFGIWLFGLEDFFVWIKRHE